MKKRIYIAGPMTLGNKINNLATGLNAFKELLKLGFAPLCPHLHFLIVDLMSIGKLMGTRSKNGGYLESETESGARQDGRIVTNIRPIRLIINNRHLHKRKYKRKKNVQSDSRKNGRSSNDSFE